MISNLSKTLMVLLLCLTFIGQTMATTVMSYHMLNMVSIDEQSHDMSSMKHSNHQMMGSSMNMDNYASSASSVEECCEKNCNCFTGSCSSIAVLSKNFVNDPVMDFSTKIISYSSLAQSQQLTSLYRPPILG